MSESHLKAAEYFAGRAERARHPAERARFLMLVQKYRGLAAADHETKRTNIAQGDDKRAEA
jgi:hypothetical protein